MKYKNAGQSAIHIKVNDAWVVVQPGQEYEFESSEIASRNNLVVSEPVAFVPKPVEVAPVKPVKKKR